MRILHGQLKRLKTQKVIKKTWCSTRLHPWSTFFLVYIIDLSDNLLSTVKLFPDDTSLFSVVNDSNILANELKKDLQKMSEWAYRWKRSFNPVLIKQAQEVVLANELKKDLQKMSEWAYKCKRSFNPVLIKQAQEVVFSRKLNKSSHPKIFLIMHQ